MTAGHVHPVAPGEDVVVTLPPRRTDGRSLGAAGGGPARAVRLRIVRHGAGPAAPVLLLHGGGTSARLWREVQHDLGRNHASIAPDLLGCGASERRSRHEIGPAGQAAALVALLDRLACARAVLVGHGLGGAVAVQLAAHHPDRVAGLVLLGTPLHRVVWPPLQVRPFVAPWADLLVSGARRVPATRAALSRALGAGRLPAGVADELVNPLLARDGAHGLVAFLRAVDIAPVELAWRLLRVAPPRALILWGDADPVVPVGYGWRLAADLPGAAWVPVTGGGHLLPLERPERVAEEVAAFAGALAAQRSGG